MRDPYFDLLPDYVAGRLDEETRDKIAVHLVSCFACRQELRRLEAEAARAVAEAEGRVTEHLSDEQIQRFVRGELTDDERDAVHAHLGTCTECEARVSAAREEFLRARAREEAAAPPVEEKPPTAPPPPEKPAPPAVERPGRLNWGAIIAAIALIAIIWIAIGTYISRLGAPPAPSPSPVAPSPTAKTPAPATPAPTPELTPTPAPQATPALTPGPPSAPAAPPEAVVPSPKVRVVRPRRVRPVAPRPARPVLALLKDGELRTVVYADGTVDAGIPLPAELADALRTKVLEGELPGGNPFLPVIRPRPVRGAPRLVEPVATMLSTPTPEFSWEPVAPGASYRVVVRSVTTELVWQSAWTRDTALRAPQGALAPGRGYRWWVEAKVNGQLVRSPAARIRLLSQSAVRYLEEQRKQFGRSHLLMGVILERLRLFLDAEAEYAALVRDNPDSPLVVKLYVGLLRRRGLSQQDIARRLEALR